MFGTVLIVLLGLASLQVWVALIRQWRASQPLLERAPRCPSPWLRFVSLVAAVYVVLHLPSTSPTTVDLTLVRQGTLFSAIEILLMIAFLTGGFQTRLKDVGIRIDDLRHQTIDGTRAFLASLLPVFLVMEVVFRLSIPDHQHPFLQLLSEDRSPLTFSWLLLAAVVIAPIREELLFRVILQDGLARRIGAAPAIGVVAVLFCAVHDFPDSVALFPLALILGYLYHQRQSAISVIITHALFNLTNLTILLLGDPP